MRFVRGVLSDLRQSGALRPDDRFVVGCPAGWNTAARTRYRDLLVRAGVENPQVISESRRRFSMPSTPALSRWMWMCSTKVRWWWTSAVPRWILPILWTDAKRAWAPLAKRRWAAAFWMRRCFAARWSAAATVLPCAACFRKAAAGTAIWKLRRAVSRRIILPGWATEAAPVAKKTLRVCYDGVQRLTLQIDNEEASHLVDDPLPELDGRSFSQAVSEALDNAAGSRRSVLPNCCF